MKWAVLDIYAVGSVIVCLAGCQSQPSAPVSPPIAGVSSAEQSQAEQVAQAYVTALQAHDLPRALLLMSSKKHFPAPVNELKDELRGSYQPFLSAKSLQFDPAQSLRHGHQMVLRTVFTSGGGKPYRTNFVLSRRGSSWLIDSIVPPITPQQPMAGALKSTGR